MLWMHHYFIAQVISRPLLTPLSPLLQHFSMPAESVSFLFQQLYRVEEEFHNHLEALARDDEIFLLIEEKYHLVSVIPRHRLKN